jgi:hypothetical protein
MTIDPARDKQGIETALRELLEESLAYQRVKGSMESAADDTRESMLASLPPRTLAAGYYSAAEHLLWVEARVKAGVPLLLISWEADGMVLLGRVRRQFEHDHPPCYKCGELQSGRFATSCHACGAEFKRGNR